MRLVKIKASHPTWREEGIHAVECRQLLSLSRGESEAMQPGEMLMPTHVCVDFAEQSVCMLSEVVALG